MLKGLIFSIILIVLLIVTGIVVKNAVDSQQKKTLASLKKNHFSYILKKNYSYKNREQEKVVFMQNSRKVTVKIWSYNLLGSITVNLVDPAGKRYLKERGKNMDDSLVFNLKKGSYLLRIDCNHLIMGGYLVGFKNIDGLREPVVMDSLGLGSNEKPLPGFTKARSSNELLPVFFSVKLSDSLNQ